MEAQYGLFEALDSRRINDGRYTHNKSAASPCGTHSASQKKDAFLFDALGTSADRRGPRDYLWLPETRVRDKDEAARRWIYSPDHHGDHGDYFLHGRYRHRRNGKFEESRQDRRKSAAVF